MSVPEKRDEGLQEIKPENPIKLLVDLRLK